MTKDEIRDRLTNLSEPLRMRLFAWPANTSLLFDTDEVAELESLIGPNWRTMLGVGEGEDREFYG